MQKKLNQYLFGFILLQFFLALSAHAEQPWSTTVDGRLFVKGTTTPLKKVVAFKLQIVNPAENCVLYEENQIYDTTLTNGYFNLKVGTNFPDTLGHRSGADPGFAMSKIFNNVLNSFPSSSLCPAGYVPSAGDARFLKVTIQPAGESVEVLAPSIALNSVPSAQVANSLSGLGRSDFLQVNSSGGVQLSQANLESVFNSTQLPVLNDLLAGSSNLYLHPASNGTATLPALSSPSSPAAGQIWYDSGVIKYSNGTTTQSLGLSGAGVQSVTAGTGLTGGTITSTGTLSVDVGTTAGQIVQLDGSAKLPAVDGSALTNLNGSAIQSGTIGGSTAVNTTGNLSAQNVSANSASFRSLTLTNAGAQSLVIQPAASITGTPNFVWPGSTGSVNQVLTTDARLANARTPVGTALTSGQVWVGNASNVATARSLNISDLKSTVAGNWFAASGACANSEQLSYSAVTDTLSCQAFALTPSQVTIALGYTPADRSNSVAKAGDTMTGALNLPSNGLAVGTSQLVVSGGNVGVGTMNPANKLDVQGGSVNSAGGFYWNGTSLDSRYLGASAAAVMMDRGSVAEASIDTAVQNGFYVVSKTGHSSGILSFNPSGSTGSFQMDANYYGLLRWRNKTDNLTWQNWRTLFSDGGTPVTTGYLPKVSNGGYGFLSNSSIYDNGNVGIGTVGPDSKLHVVGSSGATLKIVDGNQGAGKILTSDASGNASWQSASGSSSVSLYGGSHTSVHCLAGYGLLRNTSSGYLCQFTGSACPSGWTRLANWGVTHPAGGGSPCGACVSASHEFSNTATESCYYVADSWGTCTGGASVSAQLVAVGCY